MAPSLDNPRAKIARAAEHLTLLDAETAAFFESKPYEVEGEFKADVSEYVFTIKPVREPPLRLGLILGDFAHNLRSALDHLVCQLALLNGPSDCKTTQFPICSSHGEFKRHEPSWLKGLSATHIADIERLQPYHAGKLADHHFLTLVHGLDNVDKHRVVHPTFGYFNLTAAQGEALQFGANDAAGSIRWRQVAAGRRIEGDTEIVRLKIAPLGPDPKVEMYGKLLFDPAFGSEWMRGSSLPEIHKRVRNVIDSFAGDFA